MRRPLQITALLLLTSSFLTGCASRPVEPLVVSEVPPTAALTVEQAKPFVCPPVVLSPVVTGDFIRTLKGTALDYKAAQEDCARRNSGAIDLLTRVPGTPEPTPAPVKPST